MLEYQSKYPDNIKCIFLEENSGYPGKGRNIGINYAHSDYIIFLDHDDEYLKSGFKTLYNNIVKYDSDMVYANAYIIFNDKILIGKKREKKENIINIDPLANQKNFNNVTYHNSGAPWAKIYKRKFLIDNNIKYNDEIILEDLTFYLNILKHSPKVTFINDIVYNYMLYNDSTCHNHTKKLLNDYIKGIKSISQLLKDINLDTEHIISYTISQILLIFVNLNKQDKEESVKQIYELEKQLIKENNMDNIIKPERKEVEILNNAIIQKKFQKAIFISNIYKKLYNNSFIQKSYKKLRGTR